MADTLNNIHQNTLRVIGRYVEDDKSLDRIPQPMFIVGSCGSGKSTILNELVTTLPHMIHGIVNSNRDSTFTTDAEGLKREHEKGERGENVYIQGASSVIEVLPVFNGKQFFSSREIIHVIEGVDYDGSLRPSGRNSLRRIVIIDDIDYFFSRSTFEDQYLLRNYLNYERSPLLIGSVSKIDDSLANYKAPFFEGIRHIYIPPFENSLIDSLNLPDDIRIRILSLMSYLPPVIRSFKIVSEIVNISTNGENDIMELLNRFNPSYRHKLGSMPVYSQKIIYNIAKAKGPVTLPNLRELTGLPSGTLSTYLRLMVKSGDLRRTSTRRRGMSYEVRDRLFKYWLSFECYPADDVKRGLPV